MNKSTTQNNLIEKIVNFPELKVAAFNKQFKPADELKYRDEENTELTGIVWDKAYLCEITNKPIVKVLIKEYTGVAILDIIDVTKLVKHKSK